MKHKLGILTALILSLAVAGSTFAAPKTSTPKNQDKTVAKTKTSYTARTKKAKKHRKHRSAKRAKTMKSSSNSTSNSKK